MPRPQKSETGIPSNPSVEVEAPRVPRIWHPASPALQRSLSKENPAHIDGPQRDNVTGGYHPRGS